MTTLEFVGLTSGICSIIGLLIVLRDKITALFQNRIVWSTVLKGAKSIISKMEDDHYLPDVIIACGRGGLILAPLISRNLNSQVIQIINFDYYYEWENKQRRMFFEKRFLPIKDKKILVCAGQVNSGQSLVELLKEVRTYNPKDIKTACIFNNKARIISVDYVGKFQKKEKLPPWIFKNFQLARTGKL